MAQAVTRAIARRWLRPRPKNAHKGSSGRVLVIAGSRGMSGAAILCAGAAIRSGAGLVKLAIVGSQQSVAAKRAPLEITTLGLPEDAAGRLSQKGRRLVNQTIRKWKPDVIACGPGLGVTPAVKQLVRDLVYRSKTPLVLDADGLNALAQLSPRGRPTAPLVITPHAGELARLTGSTPARIQAARERFAKQAAAKFRCVCLLKGHGTLVTDGRAVYKNTSGNPAMATGGMGDVLTGIVAASWAQDLSSPLRAAAFGAYVHGLAADLAVAEFPERSLLASHVESFLPQAFGKIWRNL